jgi:hypothetical protein
VGVNVTLIVQLPPASTVEPQVSVSAKSPVTVMLSTARAPVPGFVSVTVCALEGVLISWPENVKLEGESDAPGTAPTPAKGITCAPITVLSVNVNVPCTAPGAVGVNVTPMVQLAPRLTSLPH